MGWGPSLCSSPGRQGRELSRWPGPGRATCCASLVPRCTSTSIGAPLRDVDLVFDLVGGEALRRARALIKPGAGIVSVVEPPPVEVGKRGWFFVVEPSRPQLVELGKRIVAGELRPVVGAAFTLSQGRAAFEAKQRGRQPGKVVLVVSEEH